MAKPRNSKPEIIAAIKKTARKLKRVPTRKEFNRMSGMTASQVKWAFGSFEAGLRAAGVRKLGPSGRIGTTQLLEDWGRVVREVGRHPSVNEYRALGKYSEVSLISRVGRWCNVRETFLTFVRSNGLERDWADVVQSLETGPAPRPGSANNGWLSRTESLVGSGKPGPASRQMKLGKKVLQEKPKSSGWQRINANEDRIEEGLRDEQRVEQAFRPAVSLQRIGLQPLRFGNSLGISAPTPGMGIDEVTPEFVLPELRGMRCVTRTMLWVLCAAKGSEAPRAMEAAEAEENKDLPQIHETPHADEHGSRAAEPNVTLPSPLPLELHGKRCVTPSMMWILFAGEKPSMLDLSRQNALPQIYDVAGQNPLPEIYAHPGPAGTGNRGSGSFALNLRFPRRAIPGRPMMGPPLSLNGRVPHGLVREPVSEAGVVFLFGMVAHLLGFDVEAVQGAYPDGEAKLEVEPGRWQNIRFEFEYESRKFPQHRHDPRKCDVIVCWKHNWKGCPEEIQIVELGKILRSPSS